MNSHTEHNQAKKGLKNPKKPNYKLISIIATVVVFAAAIGAAIFFYQKYREAVENPEKVAQEEAKKVGARVARLIDVPEDEVPSVATVTDKEKLKGQEFFEKAEDGDKVVIYYSTGLAYLYRPSTDKIIEVSQINTGNNNMVPTNVETTVMPELEMPEDIPEMTVTPSEAE